MKYSVKIIVPLISSSFGSKEKEKDVLRLKELFSLSEKIKLTFGDRKFGPLKIEQIDRRNIQRNKYFTPDTLIRNALYLKFSCSWNKDNWDFSGDIDLQTPVDFVRCLLMYLNIVKPGFIDSREGRVIYTGPLKNKSSLSKVEIFQMLQNNIEIAISKSEEYGWPLLEELNINDIITWIKRNWKAIRGTSSNKLERALNIFSFLFHEDLNDNGSSSDLFFCLAGIEALLVEGRDNIQEQVKSKSQLILGENLNFKKKINELYDLRSRYIHGNLDITNKYLHDEIWGDDRPGPNKTLDIVMRIYESSGFGIAIFIALIQKHIKMKKKEFEFEYVLKK